jgi:hypothetical protein
VERDGDEEDAAHGGPAMGRSGEGPTMRARRAKNAAFRASADAASASREPASEAAFPACQTRALPPSGEGRVG